MALVRDGQAPRAATFLSSRLAGRPDDLQIWFNLMDARCAAGGLFPTDAARLGAVLRRAALGSDLAYRWLGQAFDQLESRPCPGLTRQHLADWTQAADANPHWQGQARNVAAHEALQARFAVADHDSTGAKMHFDRALRADVRPDRALGQAAYLAGAGYYREALAHLDAYDRMRSLAIPPRPGMPRVHAWLLERQHYWDREETILRQEIRKAMDG
jgi:hypothetical protein